MKYICERCPLFCAKNTLGEKNDVHNFSPETDTPESLLKFLNPPFPKDCPLARKSTKQRRAIIPQH